MISMKENLKNVTCADFRHLFFYLCISNDVAEITMNVLCTSGL